MNAPAEQDSVLAELESGPLLWFREWPDHAPRISRDGTGVYTIWNDEGELIYVGVGGRPSAGAPEGRGLFGRLSAHASGRRSGDQFCVYVADRLVLPELSQLEIAEIADGRRSRFDDIIRAFIHEHLGFRAAVVPDFSQAIAIENAIRAGILAAGPPRLNPSRGTPA